MAHEAAEERSGLRAFSATGAGAADAAAGSSTEQRQAVAVDAGVELLAPQEALLWCNLSPEHALSPPPYFY